VLTSGIPQMAEYGNAKRWRISLIITTYNSLDTLKKVMASVLQQTLHPYEIIIADDGSNDGVNDVLAGFRKFSPVQIIHTWQPDNKFRLSRSRNLAGSKARGNWLLFLDGDCVVPEYFLERHTELAESMNLIFGSRKLLSPFESEQLKIQDDGSLDLSSYLTGRKFIRLPLGLLRKLPRRSWERFRGFMMGVDTRLFQIVAGFDETYASWGLEDSDFAVRATRVGGVLKDGRYSNAVLHIYHPEPSEQKKSANSLAFEALLGQGESGRYKPLKSILIDC